MSELDLTSGDPKRAARIAQIRDEQEEGAAASRARRGTAKPKSESSSSSSKSKSTSSKGSTDAGLKGQLKDAFERLAEQRNSKGDEELGTALQEEAESMAQGLISATRALPFLRQPLLFLLGVLVPVLAFWRVGSILANRWADRREAVMREREMAAAGAAVAPQPTP